MNELALFAGHGGGILGGKLLGWRTVCAVEFDGYARRVLAARQDDGCLEPFPIWDDVRTFDGKPWAGLVDVVSGGFPCQDISAAGSGAGIDGARSGLWGEMARIIREVGPRFVFVENSPMLTSRGLGRVLGDLAAMGYDACWGVLGAVHAGAPHKRERIWILAHARRESDGGRIRLTRIRRAADGAACRRENMEITAGKVWRAPEWWNPEPDVGRVANGVASRVDRLRGLGNGQVPAVAALAFQTLHALLMSALSNA
jgi:DNA (cytosine-5)-methyltransferase 1